MGSRGPAATPCTKRCWASHYSRWGAEGQPQLLRHGRHREHNYSRWGAEGQPQLGLIVALGGAIIADGEPRASRNSGTGSCGSGGHYSRWGAEGQPQPERQRGWVGRHYSRWGAEGQPQLERLLDRRLHIIADGEPRASRNCCWVLPCSVIIIADGEPRASRNEELAGERRVAIIADGEPRASRNSGSFALFGIGL